MLHQETYIFANIEQQTSLIRFIRKQVTEGKLSKNYNFQCHTMQYQDTDLHEPALTFASTKKADIKRVDTAYNKIMKGDTK